MIYYLKLINCLFLVLTTKTVGSKIEEKGVLLDFFEFSSFSMRKWSQRKEVTYLMEFRLLCTGLVFCVMPPLFP
jgi:hypothetical protein